MYNRSRFRPNRNVNRRFSSKFAKPAGDDVVMAIEATRLMQETQLPGEQKDYIAINKFSDFDISQKLKNNIIAKNYVSPTPIQDQSIGAILEGRDIIGIANTGTGKTAAFLVPLINKVIKDNTQRVLIVAPTRELALQIADELREFSNGLDINCAICIGGANMWTQKGKLRENPNFVIGTPGRIKDLIEQRFLNLSTFNNVVLDEADRMVDIGFIADIKYFISLLPKDRQSLFFSATISGKVREILNDFVIDPITVSVNTRSTAENIDQDIIKIENHSQKVDKLHDLLIQKDFEKVLIFGRTKFGIQKLTNELISRGFKAGVIHGNKSQSQRQRILDEFKRNKISILLATDVASRGLDIENVSHVINYDMPASYEDYIHRIGRTGRANKKGVALTFVG